MQKDPSKILEDAVSGIATELGLRVQESRSTVGMTAGELIQMLSAVGIVMSPDELTQLEAGTGPSPDLRLLTALVFLLEVPLDEIFVACIQDATAADSP